VAEVGFHSKWYTGTAAERAGFATAGIFVPFMWYESDTGDLYYWDGSAWQPWGGSGVAQGAGTLSVSTSNDTSDPHTHAITTSANPGAAASILASDASGYLQLEALGIQSAPTATDKPFNVTNLAVNTATTFYGFYLDVAKTAGATGATEDLYGHHIKAVFDQSGGTVRHIRGIFSTARLDGGTATGDLWGMRAASRIDGGSVGGDLEAAVFNADVNAGTVTGDVIGNRIYVETESAATISGDVQGIQIRVDDEAGAAGTVYMLYLLENSGIDYGIYQNGTAPHYLGGSVGIGATTADRLLHVERSSADTNTITPTARLSHTTSGTAAALFGTGLEVELEDAGGSMQVASQVDTLWATATAGSESPLYRVTTYPAGSAGPGYSGHWTWTGINATSRTIIPNGTGDVTATIAGIFAVSESGGGTDGGTFICDNSSSLVLYNDGTDTLTLTVAADGSVTIARSAGAATFALSIWATWV